MSHSHRILTLLLLVPFVAASQRSSENKLEKTISWTANHVKKLPDETVFRSLAFDGAVFNEDLIPVYVETLELPSGAKDFSVELQNVETQILHDKELVFHPEKIGSEFKVSTEIITRKKKSSSSISIVPIRRNGSSFEKLVSFTLKTTPIPGVQQRIAPRFSALNSVLASGSWHKIAITQNGVYKITYQQLKDMGIDVDNIDPKNIRLYGNGGGQLAFANRLPRHDDLQENAIQVNGESDGVFNASDYILFYGSGQLRWKLDINTSKFVHQINPYSDTTYYFLTTDLGNGKRIQNFNASGANTTVVSFDDRQVHEADLVNLLKSGREWYGETMDNITTDRNFSFTIPNIVTGDSTFINISLLGRSLSSAGINSNRFTVSIGSQSSAIVPFTNVGSSPQDNYASPAYYNNAFKPTSSVIPINIKYTAADPNGLGWGNYILLKARRNLSFSGSNSQKKFRDT